MSIRALMTYEVINCYMFLTSEILHKIISRLSKYWTVSCYKGSCKHFDWKTLDSSWFQIQAKRYPKLSQHVIFRIRFRMVCSVQYLAIHNLNLLNCAPVALRYRLLQALAYFFWATVSIKKRISTLSLNLQCRTTRARPGLSSKIKIECSKKLGSL